METHLITGGAGFIGTNLALSLLASGKRVALFDNLSRGSFESLGRSNDLLITAAVNCADLALFREEFAKLSAASPVSTVWHLAANSDIPAGLLDAHVDLSDTFLTTFNTLVLMREFNVSTLNFASSSAVYGDFGRRELHEDIGPLEPISNYGAMKLASEAQIRASVESYLSRANIFRFPNVVGAPATHGVILDFVRKLKVNPAELSVLGNGSQRKSYMHVEDLIQAMMFVNSRTGSGHNVFNVGPEDAGVDVKWIAEAVCSRMNPAASIKYGVEPRGWVGDVPTFVYSTRKLRSLGWRPRLSSELAVSRAIDETIHQELACDRL